MAYIIEKYLTGLVVFSILIFISVFIQDEINHLRCRKTKTLIEPKMLLLYPLYAPYRLFLLLITLNEYLTEFKSYSHKVFQEDKEDLLKRYIAACEVDSGLDNRFLEFERGINSNVHCLAFKLFIFKSEEFLAKQQGRVSRD